MGDRLLYDWFGDSVRPFAGRTALEVGNHVLSYDELDRVVRSLAVRIAGSVAGPPGRVGLLAVRSVAAYAGYLAVLRLGATVVPLNPAFPVARNTAGRGPRTWTWWCATRPAPPRTSGCPPWTRRTS